MKTRKQKNAMSFGISNQQKWFENAQLGIISQTLNSLNYVHPWTDSKLKHNWLHESNLSPT
jgi:hypothetical protein